MGTAITDGGMASLANLTNLWRVHIDGTAVGDAGLRQLSQLPKLSALTMQRTHATNACLPLLAAMPSFKVALVDDTAIDPSEAGFVGVLRNGSWHPNEARANEAEENPNGAESSVDED
jgi:hypothetical protein